MITRLIHILAAVIAVAIVARAELKPLPKDVVRVPVTFSGGHETDPRDGGRPVVLIAAALGVAPEVFRDAFSQVRPANPDAGPTGDEARRNKGALMAALGIYGITNDELDHVSNRYRYVRSHNELWQHKPAAANALVKNGSIVGFEILEPGYGYSSPPEVTVPGIKGQVKSAITFNRNVEKNGAVSTLTVDGK